MIYFDTLHVGDSFQTRGRTITETDVVQFAGLTNDYSSIHTDAAYAQGTQYGQRIAHGLLVLFLTRGLLHRAGILGTAAELEWLGISEMTFKHPALLGDTVTCTCTVKELAHPDEARDGGCVVFFCEAFNQSGTLLQQSTHTVRLHKA